MLVSSAPSGCARRSYSLAAVSLLVWGLTTAIAEGQSLLAGSTGPVTLPPGQNLVQTDTPTPLAGQDLGTYLGFNTFYNQATPITGQGTTVVNVEGGLTWNGHETLNYIPNSNLIHASDTYGGPNWTPPSPEPSPPVPTPTTSPPTSLYDRHATWTGMLIAGHETAGGGTYQQGLAYGTNLESAAMATYWSGTPYTGSFGISENSLVYAYTHAFGHSNVISRSLDRERSANQLRHRFCHHVYRCVGVSKPAHHVCRSSRQ